ncbi:hypothetical protein KORDIASMS9_00091 [Kordia sp. SMS9]|uniref:hypothetical protein n=1 Tax=Kordia sp. SMS9 TaxID=2282170 RepID=UPI000E0D6DE8|nr:hypothetical protein [Kordia sp. SMS9]AXG67909.1 hypothetical protein KORDIASMS9_00091 [Kordia sp. SMS9]
MKYLHLFLLCIFLSCTQKTRTTLTSSKNTDVQTTKSEKFINQNLYEFIGVDINSKKVRTYSKELGKLEIRDFSKEKKDYVYEDDGIQIRIDSLGIIDVIFLNNYKKESWQHKSFKGKLPFGLQYRDTFKELKNKIGEGDLVFSSGFYGRTFVWTLQDSLKLAIELELSRKDDDKIVIQQLSLHKKG